MIDARRERRLTRVVDDVVMGNQEKNVLPIGPWTRETLDLPRAIVQGMLSGSVFPRASFFAPQGFATETGACSCPEGFLSTALQVGVRRVIDRGFGAEQWVCTGDLVVCQRMP